ncbi:MAG TPA: (4Fe-4S)-binding protein [Bacteroidia bacterium]|nr:(4Fe-4S)-binding protein [Bacteroidia bacterium]
MKDITKKYTNGEITIVWKPATCIHSTVCWKGAAGLGEVFNPMEKPWIKPEAASTARIVEQIKKCPSGALSFYYNNEASTIEDVKVESVVEVMENGPLLVYGNITVKHKSGEEEHKDKVTAFCRCGQSSNKPYCDGTHTTIGFKS